MTYFINVLLWNSGLAALLGVLLYTASGLNVLRNRPALRHCLWLLVLAKLLMPPLIPLPFLGVSTPDATAIAQQHTERVSALTFDAALTAERPVKTADTNTASSFLPAKTQDDQLSPANSPASVSLLEKAESGFATLLLSPAFTDTVSVMIAISLLITLVLVSRVLMQTRKIASLLRLTDRSNDDVSQAAGEIAAQMSLRRSPNVCVVDANVAPMLWVSFGRPVIVLPAELVNGLSTDALDCIIRHELSHYLRRDHVVNAFALVVSCLFWWHPVVWVARREIRAAQEACCDAMVIQRAPKMRRCHAETLLRVVDFLDGRQAPLPQLVSSFGESHSIQRRFEMIADKKVNHRLPRGIGLFIVCFLIVAATYPAMAQQREVGNEHADFAPNASDIGGDRPKSESKSRPDADIAIESTGQNQGQCVLRIRLKGLPQQQLPKLIDDLGKGLQTVFQQTVTVSTNSDAALVTVDLHSDPMDLDSLSDVVRGLAKHFSVQNVTLTNDEAFIRQELLNHAKTLAEDSNRLEVIQLKNLDPLNAEAFLRSAIEETADSPVIEADPLGRRLLVQGKPEHVQHIRQLIKAMDVATESRDDHDAKSSRVDPRPSDSDNKRDVPSRGVYDPLQQSQPHSATVALAMGEDGRDGFAIAAFIEKYPLQDLPALVKQLTESETLDVDKVVVEQFVTNSGLSTVQLRMAPVPSNELSAVTSHLMKQFKMLGISTSSERNE